MIVAVARARKDAKALSHALNCETLSLGGVRSVKEVNPEILEKLKDKIVLFFAGKSEEKVAEEFIEAVKGVAPIARIVKLSKKAVRNTRMEEIREKFEIEKAKIRLFFNFEDVFYFSQENGLNVDLHPDYDAYFILSKEFAENMKEFFGIDFGEGNLIVRKLMNEEWIYSPELIAIVSKKIGEKCKLIEKFEREVLDIPINKIAEKNRKFLETMEKVSVAFLRKFREERIAVPFSGGKDSLTALILAKKVFKDVTAVYVKTNYEIPFTENYVEGVCQKLGVELKVVEAKLRESDFSLESRLCTKVKMDALKKAVEDFSVLVVGDREAESRVRRLRGEVVQRIKTEVFPIKYWSGAMVQLYSILNGFELHPLYYSGFYRLGCSNCPSMSEWEHFVLRRVIESK